MTDKQIHNLCREYGAMSLEGRRKFLLFLPEVYKRRIYRKYGYCSIHEYAAKLCGLSKNMVDEAIRLSEKFKQIPDFYELIGEVGLSKLKAVAGIVDKSTSEMWSRRIKSMSRKALETMVRDVRLEQENKNTNSQKFPGDEKIEQLNGQNPQPQAQIFDFEIVPELLNNQNMSTPRERFGMDLDQETIIKLRLLKQRFEKDKGEKLCWDEVMKMAAERLLKEEPVREYKQRESNSRHIPAKKRREMSKICSVPGCNKPSQEIHHKKPWAIFRNHDELELLCKAHHELAHQSDSTIDKKFRFHKMAAFYNST
jgi:hypothetical protein